MRPACRHRVSVETIPRRRCHRVRGTPHPRSPVSMASIVSWPSGFRVMVGGEERLVIAEGGERFRLNLAEEKIGDVVGNATRGGMVGECAGLYAWIAPPLFRRLMLHRADNEDGDRPTYACGVKLLG